MRIFGFCELLICIGTNTLSATLSEEQRNVAYGLAKQYRAAKTDADQKATAGKKKIASKKAGKVHFNGDRNSLTERQSASLKAMEKIAAVLGVQVYVFESKMGKNGKRIGANGWYDPADGSIHIDLHAGANGEGTMIFTMAHELTHFIRQWSPAKFKILADFLMQEYGKKGVSVDALVREQQAKAKRAGRTISYDTAYEEVVADSMEAMLSDGKVMEKLAKLKAQDVALWQKIKDYISKLAEKIRMAYKGLAPDSVEGRYVAEMKNAVERFQELFTEGLVDASANFKSSMERNGEADADIKYSIREGMSDQERYIELADKKISVLSDKNTAQYAQEIASLEALQTRAKSKAEKIIRPLAVKLGILNKPLSTSDVDVEFLFTTNGGLAESMHKQLRYGGNYVDFAKTLINLDKVLETAVLIEVHGDKYAGTVRANEHLESVYVLFGAFRDGKNLIPVQMEIKKSSDVGGRLYLTVAMTKIEADVVGSAPENNQAPSLVPASEYSLADIFREINPKDAHFLKYLPDGFLSEEQINAKNAAIEEDDVRIQTYKRRYSNRDSDGNQLSQEQQEFFKDSKVRDADGNLMVMYHGTPNGGFTKFRSGTYFTPNPGYADVYQNAGASSISTKRNTNAPMTYKVYLDIKKPFDTRQAHEHKIFMEEFYRKYGTGTPLADSGLPDWVDGLDLQEFIEEMGYDYDGLILDEGGVGGYGEEVVSRGLSYVVFDPAQVKGVDNKAPTSDPDYRYSYRGTNQDGIEVYETSDEIKKLSYKERQHQFLDIMTNEYRGRTAKFVRNGHAYYATFEEVDVNKNIYGDKRSDKKGWKAKINVGADGDIFELVENAQYDGSKPENGKKITAHRGVGYWDYFIKNVQIDGAVFDLVANVRRKADGDFVYNIQLNENKKIKASPPLGSLLRASNGVPNASGNNVTQPTPKVKPHSDRDTESVSNRSLLANAFEGVAQTDMEKQKIQEYRSKIDLMNGQEQKLRKLNQQIKELSFAKGKRDTAKIRALRDEATKTANRISIYDKQLLRLESSMPWQDSLKRANRCQQETKTPPGRGEISSGWGSVLVRNKAELGERGEAHLCLLGLVVGTGAGAAFGVDLAGTGQGHLGKGGANQLIHQHGEQHHIAHDSAVGQGRSGSGHAQGNTGLGQQGNAQVGGNVMGAFGKLAAKLRAEILAGGAGKDVQHAYDQGHRLHQHLQIQLSAGDHEKQNVQRHGPAVDSAHELFGSRADVAEDRAGHHAHQQQREAAVYRADLELDGR